MDHAAYMREWRRRNPDRERAIKQRYYRSRGRIVQAARRRRVSGAIRPYTPQGQPFEERLWEKVVKTDGCWTWRTNSPRPHIYRHPRMVSATRAMWEVTYGEVPAGLEVCHHCDNPRCVRPDHLFLGTHRDNMRDMARKGRGSGPTANGEAVHSAKLTWPQVRQIRARLAAGATVASTARAYSVREGTIRFIRNGETWRDAA